MKTWICLAIIGFGIASITLMGGDATFGLILIAGGIRGFFYKEDRKDV